MRGWFAVAGLVAAWLFAASSRAEEPLIYIQQGELPIILSAPHGGQLSIPEVDERQRNGRPTGGAGFVTSRDSHTEELAKQVAKTIEERFGKKPHVVIARMHRKFLDPNRPADLERCLAAAT